MILYRLGVLLFISIFMAGNNLLADEHSNARSKAMSTASVVSSFGIGAFGINPANYDNHLNPDINTKKLKLGKNPDKPTWEISLFSGGGAYGSDESIGFYNNYLKYLSVNRETFTGIFTDFASILSFRQNVLPQDRTQVNYALEVKWISVNYLNPKIGAVNFSVADKVGLNTDSYSRDEELPFTFQISPHGSKYDLTNININQSEATAWWIRKYSISFAKQFDFPKGYFFRNLSVGVSFGLVHGFGNIITYNTSLYVSTYGVYKDPATQINHVDSVIGRQDFHTRQSLTDLFQDYQDGAHSHFNMFPKPAGRGYSLDFGFNLQIGNDWHIAASATDLGEILWDYNTYINNDTNSFKYYNFNMNASDPTYNTFINDLDGLDTRISNMSYKTELPTKYRIGVMYHPNDKFIAEADWEKGKNNLPGNAHFDVFSGGAEYYITNTLPLRGGVSIGGPGSWYVALGTGIRYKKLVFDLACGGINQIIFNKRLSLSISGKIIL